jgi:hypothetical protein
MALTKTLTAVAEARFRTAQLGKYATMGHAATANTGFDPTTIYTDKTLLAERGLDAAENTLEQIRAAAGDAYTIAKLASSFFVYVPKFITAGHALKIVTRTSAITLTATVASNAAANNLVAFNGSFCELSVLDELDAKIEPVDPTLVTPVGFVYSGGVNTGDGRASPDGFHVQLSSSQLDLGPGDAMGGEGLGGLTPVLLKKADLNKVWKYGEKNVYEGDLPSGSPPPETGEPPAIYRPFLTVRSSAQYKKANKQSIGKAIFGYIPSKDMAVVLVQPNNPDDGGSNLDTYRDLLFSLKCEYAMGMDGSDSVMLYEYKAKKLLAAPAMKKDDYLEVAVVLKA